VGKVLLIYGQAGGRGSETDLNRQQLLREFTDALVEQREELLEGHVHLIPGRESVK
jgi:hypothetical protein